MGGDPAPAAPSAAYAEFALERFFAKYEVKARTSGNAPRAAED